jgi:hypothetical protein
VNNFTASPQFSLSVHKYSNLIFKSILRTSSVRVESDSEIVIYTLLQHRSVCAYLLAIKSLVRFCKELNFAIVVQSDGTLTKEDCICLERHLNGIQILSRSSSEQYLATKLSGSQIDFLNRFKTPSLFVKFKLLNPLFRYKGRYLIVFDSDLLFLHPPEEVIRLLVRREKRVFHLPGGNNLSTPFRRIGFGFSNVDISNFNAGFFGVPNEFSEADILEVLARVREFDESLFCSWEMEQALWAVLLNAFRNPLNLGSIAPDYVGNGWRSYHELKTRASIIHFVGTTRFRNLSYPLLGWQVIKSISK